MFGLMTKRRADAELEAARAVYKGLLAAAERERDELRAEIDHLRPLAQKHLNSLAALKQNKGRKA